VIEIPDTGLEECFNPSGQTTEGPGESGLFAEEQLRHFV
jgi:hypothetical protein